MQFVAMTYETYQATDWLERILIRRFRKWDAWATYHGARPALVLDEYVRRCVTVCVYDTVAEFYADIVVLRTISDAPPPPANRSSGGGSAPPPAPVPPPPPPRKPRIK